MTALASKAPGKRDKHEDQGGIVISLSTNEPISHFSHIGMESIISYNALDPLKREIRLLELQPGKRKDDIRCGLIHASLAEKPRYYALSYTWGDPRIRAHIFVNDVKTSITSNLEVALRHGREETRPLCLWVDALCINQSDLTERSSQVQQMRSIYRSATGVAAFIGAADDDSDYAMDLIRDIEGTGMQALEVTAKGPTPISTTRPWKALRRLFERPYWTRVWIAQELAVACRDPGINCGDKSLPWHRFIQLHRLILSATMLSDRLPGAATALGDSFNMLAILAGFRLAVESDEGSRMSLNRVFGFMGYFQATDPRDMVYALLGMGRENDRNAIVPDYTKRLEQVYADAIVYLITSETGLDTLSVINHKHHNKSLPSWVPDFAMPQNLRLQALMTVNEYSASGKTRPEASVSKEGDILGVKGLHVDTIAQVCVPSCGVIWEDLPVLEEFAMQTLEQHMTTEAARSIIHDSGAIWRTQIANKEQHPRKPIVPASERLSDIYEVLMRRKKGNEVDLDFEPSLTPEERFRLFRKPFEIAWLSVFSSHGTNPGRCFFVTEGGRLGVGPVDAQKGDKVCVLLGASLPYILRHYNDHELVGESYVHGIMHGETRTIRIGETEFCLR